MSVFMKRVMKYLCILLSLLVVFVFLYLFLPYKTYKYIRVSEFPTEIITRYVSIQGDPLCTKLYEVKEGVQTSRGVFPNVPIDLLDPNISDDLHDGDTVIISGYLYQWQEKNLITQRTAVRAVNVVDLIGWESERTGGHETKSNHDPENFIDTNYTNCLP